MCETTFSMTVGMEGFRQGGKGRLKSKGRAWWVKAVIPVLRKKRQEDQEFRVNLDYMRPCLKTWRSQVR